MKDPDRVLQCLTLDGKSITLCVYRAYEKPGELALKTADGEDVRRIERGRYQVVSTQEEFFCDAPGVP
jgi:hypothetical protein